jgi:hypothetical protein
VQLKCGPCALDGYGIGDSIEAPNGIYVGHNGFVCIENGYVVGVSDALYNSNGDVKFKSKDLLTFDSDFYRILYGDKVINAKKRKMAKAIDSLNAMFKKKGRKEINNKWKSSTKGSKKKPSLIKKKSKA